MKKRSPSTDSDRFRPARILIKLPNSDRLIEVNVQAATDGEIRHARPDLLIGQGKIGLPPANGRHALRQGHGPTAGMISCTVIRDKFRHRIRLKLYSNHDAPPRGKAHTACNGSASANHVLHM
ncbi:hypothetical protein RHIZ404_210288 [Rhizobium sp. EC-SD404]|nr:hypothetical protein RHIZ404_210288 [Rhizobium sp. EC-SD404]